MFSYLLIVYHSDMGLIYMSDGYENNEKNIVGLISSWSDSEKICLGIGFRLTFSIVYFSLVKCQYFVKPPKVLEYCPNRTLSHLMKLSPIRRVPEEASVEIITQGMHSICMI